MRTVAVFFGGESCENEISILTGVFVLNVLSEGKYAIMPIYVHTDGLTYYSPKMTSIETFKNVDVTRFKRVIIDDGAVYTMGKKCKKLAQIDVVLNCCHGGKGEGGGVSAIAEWNHLPLASPDTVTSGIFLDKGLTKLIAKSLNIPVLDYIRVNEKDYEKRGAFLLKSVRSRLKYPVVVKPSHLGSSIGISVAKNETELKAALTSAFTLDNRVIVEKYLENKRDVNCAACLIKGEICVSEAEEAFGDGIYSFEDKYVKRTADREKGDGKALGGEVGDKIRAYTKTLYKRTDLTGVVRMDYLVSGNKAYLCEVNTVPGSLAYYLFCERISDAKQMFTDLLDEAIASRLEKKVISTGILQTVKRIGK
jgi:D-alanine-D-alanine ligase